MGQLLLGPLKGRIGADRSGGGGVTGFFPPIFVFVFIIFHVFFGFGAGDGLTGGREGFEKIPGGRRIHSG